MTTPQACRGCGCTDPNSCWDEASNTPCFWAEPDLCSSCAGQVSDEEMKVAERLSLFYAAMDQCLREEKRPVLIIMQNNDDPSNLSYISALEVEETGKLLQHLIDVFPDTPSSNVDMELQVGKMVLGSQGPGIN